MGTVAKNKEIYQNCIEALGNTDYQVILSLGENTLDDRELPDNIELYETVDQMAVLSISDVFLTHCGMNSTRHKRLFPNRSMQALDIVGNSKIYMSSGLKGTMSLSKFTQTAKKLSRKIRYIKSSADPLPKNTYEVEGMQAQGGSLYYCLTPTNATDGSKFPQYIVSVDR